MLNDHAKKVLLDLAAQAVKDFLEGDRDESRAGAGLFPDELQEKKGIFVAIYNRGRLRGCIGSLLGVLPLWQACRENARGAAVKDVRFSPVTREELPDLEFEITIIGPARSPADPSQVRPGIDGLVLRKGFRREVFFPGAVAGLMNEPEKLFDALKHKAGFEADDPAEEEWQVFEAEVISDKISDFGFRISD
jgi:AmmeMemoRadiSam system protein A